MDEEPGILPGSIDKFKKIGYNIYRLNVVLTTVAVLAIRCLGVLVTKHILVTERCVERWRLHISRFVSIGLTD